MSLAFPGARNMFSAMYDALTNHRKGTSINLNKGVHQSIVDVCWMLNNMKERPTKIAELVLLKPSPIGYWFS